MLKKIGLTLLMFLTGTTAAYARDFRLNQIPNSPNSCGTCHVNRVGGGARNAFGEDVRRTLIIPSGGVEMGNVDWSMVYNLDSDNDGITNGAELGDPNGTWMTGDANPGGTVSNPGDPNDPNQTPGNGGGGDSDVGGGCSAVSAQTLTWPLLAIGLAVFVGRRRERRQS